MSEMIYKTMFLVLMCTAAMGILLASRLAKKVNNPKMDTLLARIALLAWGALIIACPFTW